MKILIVEDERSIANLIDWNLSSSGYTCTCVYDGLTAANLIENYTYDPILLDIMLPVYMVDKSRARAQGGQAWDLLCATALRRFMALRCNSKARLVQAQK